MLCGILPCPQGTMSVRLGQFYAFVLLLICLTTNVVFFSDVRESFLGDDDPLASTKAAFSDLNLAARIAEFYPAILSNANTDPANADGADVDKVDTAVDDVPDITPPAPHVPIVPIVPIIEQPAKLPALPEAWGEPVKEEPPAEVISPEKPVEIVVSIPAPVVVAAKPAIADQFKPIMAEPMIPVRLSSNQ